MSAIISQSVYYSRNYDITSNLDQQLYQTTITNIRVINLSTIIILLINNIIIPFLCYDIIFQQVYLIQCNKIIICSILIFIRPLTVFMMFFIINSAYTYKICNKNLYKTNNYKL